MEFVCDLLETLIVSVSFFLIKKYICLEKDLPKNRQNIFYLISAVVIGAVFFLFGKLVAEGACAAAVGINIVLSRKKPRKLLGLFMMFSLSIINGIMVPLMVVPPYLFSIPAEIYQLIVYGVLIAAFAAFLILGKDWRRKFTKDTRDRELSVLERVMLMIGGALSQIFSLKISETVRAGSDAALDINGMIAINSLFAVAMTGAFVIMIIQGNKRNYYLRKYNDMQSHIITTMADIIENRDESTGGHIRRTAKYVEILAKELQKQGKHTDILTNQYISDMVMAAPLHDIGKIHISDTVLNKPGRLTDEEFAQMKTHTTAGRELLEKAKGDLGDIRYLNIAIEMAAYHHEWQNGNGYPYGVKGDEIPLCAKILAVADVFDALTSKRCYKAAMPYDKACAIIREERGTHFDGSVVDAFVTSSEKILAAMSEFNSENGGSNDGYSDRRG